MPPTPSVRVPIDGGASRRSAFTMTDAIRPPDPAAAFRRALDGALTAAGVARIGLHLLERHLDGGERSADRDPLLHNLADAADRLRDEIRTLTELADAALGGTDRVIRIE